VSRVADYDAGEQLDQRDRQPDLDRDRRCEKNRSRENCSYRDVAQLYLREAWVR